MCTAIELIEAGRRPSEVVKAISDMSESELDNIAEFISDDQIFHLGQWTVNALHSAGVKTRLYYGGLLTFYESAAKGEGRAELYTNVCDELEIDRQRASDLKVVFRDWSKDLIAEPELMPLLPTVSLRLLSRKYIPQEARDAALEIARKGDRVTKKMAEQLCEEDGEELPDAVGATPHKQTAARKRSLRKSTPNTKSAKVFRHAEEDTRVIVESSNPEAKKNPVLILSILERAVVAYKNICGLEETAPQPLELFRSMACSKT